MNSYIKQIAVFSENGEKRTIGFEKGLNIITGESKTGKSALIEIVDFCLCSKTSTIPQGEISNFGYLYVVIFVIGEKYLIVGRKSYWKGGNTKIYVVAKSLSFQIENLALSSFANLKELLLKKEGQIEIEKHFGMAVTNMAESDDVLAKDKRKSSLREMVSFLFQHQNLIANKHALFYRFDDLYKRQATVISFPIFAGWVSSEYYSLLRHLDAKKKELRQHELLSKRKQEANKNFENGLKGEFRNYYALIGENFDESLVLQQLIELKKHLPNYSANSYLSDNIQTRYTQLKKQREEKRLEFNKLSKAINDLETSQKYANEYEVSLDILEQRLINQKLEESKQNYVCPTCGGKCSEIVEKIDKLLQSKQYFLQELQQVSNYAISYQGEIDKLSTQKEIVKQEIKALNTQITQLEKTERSLLKEKKLSEQSIEAKVRLEYRIEQYLNEINISVKDADTEELIGEIETLKQRLTKFPTKNKYKQAESFLNDNMNKIAHKLDFEEQLKPIDLWFYLQENFSGKRVSAFTLVHQSKVGSINLGEMGSGANWLTCHLSLFLSLLHYFVKEKSSLIPNFLFFDQPSQVYFPNEFDKNNDDVKQVAQIYKAILEEIDEITEKTGITPQVIVTDHADSLDLGKKYKYEDYVRKRWRNGKKLI